MTYENLVLIMKIYCGICVNVSLRKGLDGEKVACGKKLLGHGIQWQEIIYSPKVDTYG